MGFPARAPKAATVYPIPILVLKLDVPGFSFAIVKGGGDTMPPAARSLTIPITARPAKVLANLQKDIMMTTATPQGSRTLRLPYLTDVRLYHRHRRARVVPVCKPGGQKSPEEASYIHDADEVES